MVVVVCGMGATGEFYGISGRSRVRKTGRRVSVSFGLVSHTDSDGASVRPCVFCTFRGASIVSSRIDSSTGAVRVFVPRRLFPSRDSLWFSVGFPDGGPSGDSGASTPVVAVFSRSLPGGGGGGGWTDCTASSCSAAGPSESELLGVVSAAYARCVWGGLSDDMASVPSGSLRSGLLRLPDRRARLRL